MWRFGLAYHGQFTDAVEAEGALGVGVVTIGDQVESAGALFQAVGRDLAVGQRATPDCDEIVPVAQATA